MQDRGSIIRSAIYGSQPAALDFGMGSPFDIRNTDLVEAMESAIPSIKSIDIFRRYLKPLDEGSDGDPLRSDVMEWCEGQFLQLHDAAKLGAVDLMELLVQRGAPIKGPGVIVIAQFSHPISLAALHGHEKAVRWCLRRASDLSDSLHAAVAAGSRNMVQLLLKCGATMDPNVMECAMYEAVKRENEHLFKLLVAAWGPWGRAGRLDWERTRKAHKIAKTKGLESMMKLIQEHSQNTVL